ncbi:MAG: RNase H family protein [Bacteroidia bacterium]|nr:hypothetical protein [Bacteroidia bacterium]MDW8158947.1 RNase H family protein [Bacteroidia bacterium]
MTAQIYVDGSYYGGRVGYGAVILREDQIIKEFSGKVSPEYAQHTRQVAGELIAVGHAINWCKKNNISEVEIYYDYTGIEKWATGEWKANLPLTQRYARFMQNLSIKVTWKKVKSHSGNKWNEYVDKLAKEGATKGQENNREQPTFDFEATLIQKAQQIAEYFVRYLQSRENIYHLKTQIQLDKAYNQQFFRIKFYYSSQRIIYLDIYNTKNKPFHLRILNCDCSILEQNLLHEWNLFRQKLNIS